ncbi:MAG: arginine--tRNA ligase [Bdellovibrionota bacterium]
MKSTLKSALAAKLSTATGLPESTILPLLERPKNLDHGDLAFPCFLVAKQLKVAPPACAAKLAAELALPDGFSGVSALGPFLNFRFDRARFASGVVSEIRAGRNANIPGERATETTILEYSSPNIAKPFHVGHLRATLIGNSLDRIYRRLGYRVVSINHLGDWGTQFGFVWAGCALWGKPDQPTVKTLVELYRRATSLKEEQEAGTAEVAPGTESVNEMARAFFIDLEAGKDYAIDFWKWCSEISLKYLRETYDRLGVSFEHYTGESFYSNKLDAVKSDLEQAGLLVASEGALGVDLGEQLGFARILTPDGRSLYLTRDLATAKYRAETFHFSRALYVVGAPQSLHFQQLKGVLKALGRDYAEKIVHVAFGHVLGMKTRGASEIIELNDFLDEAYERALTAYREQVSKRPDGLDETKVADAVAIGAIVFGTLNRGRIKDVHFSWENALEFQGDSGPYLLYACARMNGIREKADEAGLHPAEIFAPELLSEESAFQLASTLDNFWEVLERTAEENDPAVLAGFALDVAKAFSKAYNELKVVGAERPIAEARLALFDTTQRVLAETISLLGMKPLDRM